MEWAGWLFLLAILIIPAVICGVLYSDKSGSTPCIGCGECIRTGKCVLVKRRKTASAEKRQIPFQDLTKPLQKAYSICNLKYETDDADK